MENNISPEIILYLDQTPSRNELISLLDKLGISARDLVRSSEDAYMELGLANTDVSDNQLIDAMISEPKLIQRPIVVAGNRAVIGRPPENVLDLL